MECVLTDVEEPAGVQIGKAAVLAQDRLAMEAAFFEDARGGGVIDVAGSFKASHSEPLSQRDHRVESLGSIALAPGVLGEDVAGDGPVGLLKVEPG